ncbi:hypothetical protein LCGC14_0956760 [marine sediment metagenome]|uniref:Uncharacterized protein n=1 Tax=marine sediment metagenome TaxID=412755 RepID=A0A0F9QZ22_9ZZZZ
MTNYGKWKTVRLSSFRNAVMPLDEVDFLVWNFMKKCNIKSMNVKYLKPKTSRISIKLESISYKN